MKILLYLCAIFLLISHLEASKNFYTIQTGTFTHVAIGHAKRHFDMLTKILNEDECNYLRIEQGKKYYIVRVGKFEGTFEAGKLLKKVKTFVSDAFILKGDNFEDIQIVRLYEKPSPPSEKEISTDQTVRWKPGTAMEKYYTLQIKNFLKLKDARNEFDSLTQKLNEKDLANLRIERAGRYFSIRLGKFESYNSAKEFLTRMGDAIQEVIIIKGKSADEQIITMYGDTSPPKIFVLEQTGAFDKEMAKGKKTAKPDAEKQKKEIELFIKDVSTEYYNEQYGKAAELLRKGIAKWPDDPDLYAWYGATLLNMKYPENALEQYRKAAKMSPDVPDYHAGVGLSLYNIYMDRAKESIDAFNKALAIDPQNVSALEGLGFVYVSIGKKDLALELYNRLSTLDNAAANRLYQAITQETDWEKR